MSAPSTSPSATGSSTTSQVINACGSGSSELRLADASSPLSLGGELDRRASSIAALRLKAREHEIRIEMMRKNGTDLPS